jgi:signal transduction histidine kinase
VSWVLVTVSVVLVGALVQQRRRAAKARARVRRLEALGRDLATLQATHARRLVDISHELRSPLTRVLGLEEGRNPAVAGNVRRMLRMVDELTDAAQQDADQLPFEPVRMQPGPAIQQQVDALSTPRTRIEAEGLDHLPVMLLDPGLVGRMVQTLLANALRFTPAGGTVRVLARFDDEGLRVDVKDEGPGIPVEVQAHLFDRHRTGHVLREQDGSGLALAIARELAALHGGTLTLHSVVGRGSTFSLWLPAEPPLTSLVLPSVEKGVSGVARLREQAVLAELHRDEERRAPPHAPLLLLAEDNADLRDFLAWQLGRTWRVVAASDGDEALDLARKAAPDLILADVLMPRMNGHDLVRAVRGDPVLRSVPVLLLSGRNDMASIVEGLGAGADGYLTKPFHLAELEAWLASMLRGRAAEERLEERDSRLAAVGMMASGLAHDLRNPLAIVHSVSEIARETAKEDGHSELVEDLDTILTETQRIARLLRELTDFARGKDSTRAPEDTALAGWLLGLVEAFRPAFPGCELCFDDRSSAAVVPLEQDGMRRAVENLLTNARDAGATRIRIVAEPLAIVVSDNGPGIEERMVNDLFRPWVTHGKEDGTGLGLAIVQNTLVSRGGRVVVQGRGPDGGACFRLELPTVAVAP